MCHVCAIMKGQPHSGFRGGILDECEGNGMWEWLACMVSASWLACLQVGLRVWCLQVAWLAYMVSASVKASVKARVRSSVKASAGE